jgi:hypothetical protein
MTRGVICMAQNNQSTDYIKLAYLQRLSLKLVDPDLPYALVTDQTSADTITEAQKSSFDHVIILPVDWAQDQEWKQRNDWQLFQLSPFTQTIKVESDLLFTNSIAHWWRMLEHRDLVLSLGCRDYQGRPNISRAYRKMFDVNNLPDIYSGLMYWRKSQTAATFFANCKQLYQNWHVAQKELIQCDDPGSNDMVFALAALLVGVDNVTLPSADFFQFIHFKPEINRMSTLVECTQQCTIEVVPPLIRINGRVLEHPFHYYDKQWATNERIQEYERTIGI